MRRSPCNMNPEPFCMEAEPLHAALRLIHNSLCSARLDHAYGKLKAEQGSSPQSSMHACCKMSMHAMLVEGLAWDVPTSVTNVAP
jgi:hypothetical protein